MAKEHFPPRFDINAAVVFRLGEELITDVVQALVELVKNSYDADATWVNVTIDTRAENRWGRTYSDAAGAILVEDNGHGMDEETIRRGWLTISELSKARAEGRRASDLPRKNAHRRQRSLVGWVVKGWRVTSRSLHSLANNRRLSSTSLSPGGTSAIPQA